MPWFWIVAGPNGAGKSTLVEKGLIQAVTGSDLLTLNADVRTRALLGADPLLQGANLRAAIEIDAMVAETIEEGADLLVETVLSSDKYLDDVDRARTLGYGIAVVYVGLAIPGHSVARVALRHSRGGHDVPLDRIAARWPRSIAMPGRLVETVDRLFVFDNTADTGPRLIAIEVFGRTTVLEPGRIPEIDAVLAEANDLPP